MTLWRQQWGDGTPLVALHPLALESTVFAGLAQRLARRGMRTIAVDLPGFGRSPGPPGALTPARMAEPVIELARELEEPPILLGMSMGGRVALEAALIEPSAFRGVVGVAPFLPWRRRRWLMPAAKLLDPRLAAWVPLEHAWPLLARLSAFLEARPAFEHDWTMRASARVAYYLSCPATRAHLIAATRDMALDPAFGPHGTWTRLAGLSLPAAFVWGGRDRLIPRDHAEAVAALLPLGHHAYIPCSGHFMNGRHFGCFEGAMADAVVRASRPPRRRRGARGLSVTPCRAHAEAARQPAAGPGRGEVRG
jgi:pimeloyl-ACP methyl ester carboxylesterase